MRILFVSMCSFNENASVTIQNKLIVKGLIDLGHFVDALTINTPNVSINHDLSINDINDIINKSFHIESSQLYTRLMATKRLSNNEPKFRNLEHCDNILSLCLKTCRPYMKVLYDRVSIYDARKLNIRNVKYLNIDYNKYDVMPWLS